MTMAVASVIERDRHVHIEAACFEAVAAGTEKRLGRIGDGRHGDERRQPMEQTWAAWSMSLARPAHTETDSSMTLARAGDAKAPQQVVGALVGSVLVAIERPAARPARSSASINACGRHRPHRSVRQRAADRSARASATPGVARKAR